MIQMGIVQGRLGGGARMGGERQEFVGKGGRGQEIMGCALGPAQVRDGGRRRRAAGWGRRERVFKKVFFHQAGFWEAGYIAL
jgi:hypothetical protein